MSPMFNGCMNAGTPGPPNNLGPQGMPNNNLNGPGNLPPNNINEPPGFYNPSPHFNQGAPPQPHPSINFNNQIPRNIQVRPSGPPIYEFRIYELTKRLSERPENADNPWWDQFASEFFDDRSTLTIQVQIEENCPPKQHTIGRTLIPRYFRTLFEEGVQDFSIRIKYPQIKELPNRTAILDCEQCKLITQHSKPIYKPQLMHYPGMDPLMMKENKDIGLMVSTEGRLIVDFIQEHESLRIKSWNFTPTNFQEFIFKNIIAMHTQQMQQSPQQLQEQISIIDQLSKNVTRQGFTNSTINHLNLFVLLEPMQMIMSRHKELESSTPRDCLKNVLFNKWQTNVVQPQESQRPTKNRRKRKSSTPNNATGGNSKKKGNTQLSPNTPNFPLATQDVMVVGEPCLMGMDGEFGDEDERIITRLENNQYDSTQVPTNGLDENDFSALSGNPSGPNPNLQQGPPQQLNQQNVGPPTPQQINQSPSQQQPNNQLNNSNQWPGPQINNQQTNGPVNNSNNSNNGLSNPPSIGPQSIEDKKPSPISQ